MAPQIHQQQPSQQQLPKQQQQHQDNNPNKRNITLVVPFIPGTSEKFKILCKAKGIQVHYKGTNTLRTMLGNPKDKDPKSNKSGIIYHYKCPHINCPDAYIGESGRALGDWVKEHLKAPSPIHQHSTTTGHTLDPEQFNIVHKEVHNHSRTIKEAMFIGIHDPTLNRNLGKYHLLQASPTLQLKSSSLPALPYTHPNHNLSHNTPTTHTVGHTVFLGKYQMPAHKPSPNTPKTPTLPNTSPYSSTIWVSFSIFIC